ncbi:splicing regulatory glutamine/lysine-rich protein 1-like isoform X1 [Gallus gallus]|uniref:splicing regulatory glutamine/lysine-rich protein 1-like isoform X1 n=1 Tax=Gallus gallus TaxID=9031 RepID=UPI001F00AFCA|nr:splicing regulatory glutamine/lysine-rich protein 1-like isoform X1 [Gallus gallus]
METSLHTERKPSSPNSAFGKHAQTWLKSNEEHPPLNVGSLETDRQRPSDSISCPGVPRPARPRLCPHRAQVRSLTAFPRCKYATARNERRKACAYVRLRAVRQQRLKERRREEKRGEERRREEKRGEERRREEKRGEERRREEKRGEERRREGAK